MRSRFARYGAAVVLAVATDGIGAAILGAGPAMAASSARALGAGGGITGTFAVSYVWHGGHGKGVFDVAMRSNGKFSDVTDGGGGTYKYKHDKLTFKFTSNDCGTVYTGTGTPTAGFAGTSVVHNVTHDTACLPPHTTGTWTAVAVTSTAAGSPGVGSGLS